MLVSNVLYQGVNLLRIWKYLQDQAAATHCNKIRLLGPTFFLCLESRLTILIIVRVTTTTAFPLVTKVVFQTHRPTTLAVLPYFQHLFQQDLAINLILPPSWPAVRNRKERSVSPTKEERQLCRKLYFFVHFFFKCIRTRWLWEFNLKSLLIRIAMETGRVYITSRVLFQRLVVTHG